MKKKENKETEEVKLKYEEQNGVKKEEPVQNMNKLMKKIMKSNLKLKAKKLKL